jgi:hypothetical protein
MEGGDYRRTEGGGGMPSAVLSKIINKCGRTIVLQYSGSGRLKIFSDVFGSLLYAVLYIYSKIRAVTVTVLYCNCTD